MPFGSILSGIAGSALSAVGGLIGNRQTRQSVADQMAWQESMANTAHQRQVADMRAAGLNPILSATGGAGAATPQGAHAVMENVFKDVSTNAKTGYLMKAEKEQLEANAAAANESARSGPVQRELMGNQAQAALATEAAQRASASLAAQNELVQRQVETLPAPNRAW